MFGFIKLFMIFGFIRSVAVFYLLVNRKYFFHPLLQRVSCKEVNESTFYGLMQYFSIILFECSDSDDFSPAKSLMNMAFTFYHIGKCCASSC